MKRLITLCLVAWASHPSASYAQHAPELLRQRVLQELLIEGISLERLEQDIMLFHKGEGLWLQLQDARGEMLAQRFVPKLPDDLEATVAQLVVLVVAMLQTPSTLEPAPPGVAPRIPTPRPEPQPNAQALEDYQQRFIGLDEGLFVNRDGAVMLDAVPYLGKYKKPLRGVDFYKAVGRQDLAEAYSRNLRTIRGLSIAGSALFLAGLSGGIAYSVVAAKEGCSECDPPQENTQLKSILIGVGGIFGGAGLAATILVVIRGFLPGHPVSPPEARKLIDDHNKQLRQELNLPSTPSPAPPKPNLPRLGVAPFVGAQGGGLGVFGRF